MDLPVYVAKLQTEGLADTREVLLAEGAFQRLKILCTLLVHDTATMRVGFKPGKNPKTTQTTTPAWGAILDKNRPSASSKQQTICKKSTGTTMHVYVCNDHTSYDVLIRDKITHWASRRKGDIQTLYMVHGFMLQQSVTTTVACLHPTCTDY